MTEELRRLEYERKSEKVYNKRNTQHMGITLGESKHYVRHSNMQQNTLLQSRLHKLRKEQTNMQHTYYKSLDNVKQLRKSIDTPVSVGLVESDRAVYYGLMEDRRHQYYHNRAQQPLTSLKSINIDAYQRCPRSKAELRNALSYSAEVVREHKRMSPRQAVVLVYR